MWYMPILPKWLSLGLLGISSLLMLGYTTKKLCPYFGGKKKVGGVVLIEE